MDPKVSSFRDHLSTAGLFLDFDGTLSEIVERPEDARPVEGVAGLLADLAARAHLVAIVSGRSAHQLVEWLGPDVEIWGVHGAETAREGAVSLSEAARPYASTMVAARDRLSQRIAALGVDAIQVEDKGVVVNAHYRRAVDPAAARELLAPIMQEIAEELDLVVGTGRMTFELKPKADFSKERVVRERAREESLRAAAFIGDDTVDLPAFDALDDLAETGIETLRVAVRSDESDPELLRRADVIVDGPPGAVAFLRELLA